MLAWGKCVSCRQDDKRRPQQRGVQIGGTGGADEDSQSVSPAGLVRNCGAAPAGCSGSALRAASRLSVWHLGKSRARLFIFQSVILVSRWIWLFVYIHLKLSLISGVHFIYSGAQRVHYLH